MNKKKQHNLIRAAQCLLVNNLIDSTACPYQ